MKDARQALVTGLHTALTAACNASVYSRMPKAADITYPYIQIGDIYDEESGPKDQFLFNYDVLINVVYKDQSSLTAFFADINNVKSTVNNNVPFSIGSGFRIIESTLTTASTTEFEDADGTILNVAAVRVMFYIAQST
jgi:hypothetical protein